MRAPAASEFRARVFAPICLFAGKPAHILPAHVLHVLCSHLSKCACEPSCRASSLKCLPSLLCPDSASLRGLCVGHALPFAAMHRDRSGEPAGACTPPPPSQSSAVIAPPHIRFLSSSFCSVAPFPVPGLFSRRRHVPPRLCNPHMQMSARLSVPAPSFAALSCPFSDHFLRFARPPLHRFFTTTSVRLWGARTRFTTTSTSCASSRTARVSWTVRPRQQKEQVLHLTADSLSVSLLHLRSSLDSSRAVRGALRQFEGLSAPLASAKRRKCSHGRQESFLCGAVSPAEQEPAVGQWVWIFDFNGYSIWVRIHAHSLHPTIHCALKAPSFVRMMGMNECASGCPSHLPSRAAVEPLPCASRRRCRSQDNNPATVMQAAQYLPMHPNRLFKAWRPA